MGGSNNVAHGGVSGVLAGFMNTVCDDNSSIASGYQDAISSGNDAAKYAFIGAGQSNTITGMGAGEDSSIVSGQGNTVGSINSFVGAGQYNTITGGYYDAIVGGGSNSNNGAQGSLIGAGESNTIADTVTDGVVVGGSTNLLYAPYGFIGSGEHNTVTGEGGYIAAGGYNTVSGEGAVIDGGFNSTAHGAFATIPGGYVNSAAGTYSFAAGARASAAQTGSFVWSDGSDGDTILTASAAYQFLARASGGFTLYTNAASTVGAQLAAGSGTWASLSDRHAKTNIVPLDGDAVLAKVDALPISRWSYKSERGVRHVGPMAQDFYAAFKVGEDDKHITSIDEDGVALAAIKALHRDNATLHAENAHLRAASVSQSKKIAVLQTQLERLSAKVASLR